MVTSLHLSVHSAIHMYTWMTIFTIMKPATIIMKTTHVNTHFRLYVILILSIISATIVTGIRIIVDQEFGIVKTISWAGESCPMKAL